MPTPLTDLPTWVLSSAAVRSRHRLQERLAEAGVSGYEYRCLNALAEHDGLSQTDLGAAAALDPRDVTHTVRALEARGLLSRAKDPRHGRRRLVSLTESGRSCLDRIERVMADIQAEVFHDLDAAELTTLIGLLDRVGR